MITSFTAGCMISEPLNKTAHSENSYMTSTLCYQRCYIDGYRYAGVMAKRSVVDYTIYTCLWVVYTEQSGPLLRRFEPSDRPRRGHVTRVEVTGHLCLSEGSDRRKMDSFVTNLSSYGGHNVQNKYKRRKWNSNRMAVGWQMNVAEVRAIHRIWRTARGKGVGTVVPPISKRHFYKSNQIIMTFNHMNRWSKIFDFHFPNKSDAQRTHPCGWMCSYESFCIFTVAGAWIGQMSFIQLLDLDVTKNVQAYTVITVAARTVTFALWKLVSSCHDDLDFDPRQKDQCEKKQF